MDIFHKINRRLALYRNRFQYEIVGVRYSDDALLRKLGGATGPGNERCRAVLRRCMQEMPAGATGREDGNTLSDEELGRLRQGRVRVLGRDFSVDADTDWHREPFHGVRRPRTFVGAQGDKVAGTDLVLLWHLNRMMFLLDYARAYRQTGDAWFARRWFEIVDGWCKSNPYMVGMNWRSPMEVGTRLVVWSLSLTILRECALPDDEVCRRILESTVRQGEFLASNFSRRETPNNHLIGEAATLFAFASYWSLLEKRNEWRDQAEGTLVAEADQQILDDGFDYEQSINYHVYVLDFFLVYLQAKIARGESLPDGLDRSIEALSRTMLHVVAPSGRLPQIGDDSCDEFFALKALHRFPRLDEGGGATLRSFLEEGFGAQLASSPYARIARATVATGASRWFSDAGVAVWRRHDTHAVFTAGPQHDRAFADGHMHADAGSFDLELDGRSVVVDPGTGMYFLDAAKRNALRRGSAHNSVLVDDVEPMPCEAVFRWRNHAPARIEFEPHLDEDGYRIACRRALPGRGGSGFEHRRTFAGQRGIAVVVDRLRPLGGAAVADHRARVRLLTPYPRDHLQAVGDSTYRLGIDAGAYDFEFTASFDFELSAEDAVFSRWYADSAPATRLCATVPVGTDGWIVTVIRRADMVASVEGVDAKAVRIRLETPSGARILELGEGVAGGC